MKLRSLDQKYFLIADRLFYFFKPVSVENKKNTINPLSRIQQIQQCDIAQNKSQTNLSTRKVWTSPLLCAQPIANDLVSFLNVDSIYLIRLGGFSSKSSLAANVTIEPCHEKTNVLVSDLVRHKPGCTATEDC